MGVNKKKSMSFTTYHTTCAGILNKAKLFLMTKLKRTKSVFITWILCTLKTILRLSALVFHIWSCSTFSYYPLLNYVSTIIFQGEMLISESGVYIFWLSMVVMFAAVSWRIYRMIYELAT